MVGGTQVTLAALDAETAAAMLAGTHALDPRGIAREEDVQRIARDGQCFALTADGGAQIAYVLVVRGGQAWINAAKGLGPVDWTALTLPVVELQAKRAGLESVAFQTRRRGLVRKAEKLGYRVTGYIMKKDIA